jgi:hypothetical protein
MLEQSFAARELEAQQMRNAAMANLATRQSHEGHVNIHWNLSGKLKAVAVIFIIWQVGALFMPAISAAIAVMV